jgi:hypothetical protein
MSDETVTIVLDRGEMAARGRIGGLTTASRHDMAEIARRARGGLEAKFLREAGGDPVRAGYLKRLYYARLVLASVTARRAKKRTAPAVGSAGTVNAINDRGDDHDRAA